MFLILACLVVLVIVIVAYLRWGPAGSISDREAWDIARRHSGDIGELAVYRYLGEEVVYVAPALGRDMYNYVYDRRGVELGAPLGGISGRGDGRLRDWGERAVLLRIVDMREKE